MSLKIVKIITQLYQRSFQEDNSKQFYFTIFIVFFTYLTFYQKDNHLDNKDNNLKDVMHSI